MRSFIEFLRGNIRSNIKNPARTFSSLLCVSLSCVGLLCVGLSCVGLLCVSLLCVSSTYGMQIITPVEGETTFVEISQKDLTVIKTPISNIKAFSGSKNIDVRVEGKNILIKYTGLTPELQELVIVGADGEIYPVVLKPTGIPTETIILRMRESELEALEWEKSHSYINLVKELIKSMYLETPPRGYSVNLISAKKPVNFDMENFNMSLKKRYTGALLIGEVYTVKSNKSEQALQLTEKDFYGEGILAVSIEKPKIGPKEETTVYIVRKKT